MTNIFYLFTNKSKGGDWSVFEVWVTICAVLSQYIDNILPLTSRKIYGGDCCNDRGSSFHDINIITDKNSKDFLFNDIFFLRMDLIPMKNLSIIILHIKFVTFKVKRRLATVPADWRRKGSLFSFYIMHAKLKKNSVGFVSLYWMICASASWRVLLSEEVKAILMTWINWLRFDI